MNAPSAWKGAPVEPATLMGQAVRLEPLSTKHAPDLYTAGQDPDIWTYLADPSEPFASEQAALTWVEHALGEERASVRIPFAIVHQTLGRAIGSTSYFYETRWANATLEIGSTWLNPSYFRTRVNTECKLLLLTHAFETLKAIRVELMTDVRNLRSQKAIERLGATKEGVYRAHMLRNSGFRRDSVYYSILDNEWPAVKARLSNLLRQ